MLASDGKDLSIFSGKVRVRVCGLLEENGKLLLIKHHSLGPKGFLWIPPGGGVSFGESANDALKREFREETGLNIEVMNFLFVFEMINEKHHAIELFYQVKRKSGDLSIGKDPELSDSNQIIDEVAFLSYDEIDQMDPDILHGIFKEVGTSEKVAKLRGLFSFKY